MSGRNSFSCQQKAETASSNLCDAFYEIFFHHFGTSHSPHKTGMLHSTFLKLELQVT